MTITSKYIFLLVPALLVTMLIGIAVGMHVKRADTQVEEITIDNQLANNKTDSENTPKMVIEVIPQVQLLMELSDMNNNPNSSHYFKAEQEELDDILEQMNSILTILSMQELYHYISIKNSYSVNKYHLRFEGTSSPIREFNRSFNALYQQSHYKTQNYESDVKEYTEIIHDFKKYLNTGLYEWLTHFFGQSIDFYNIILIPGVDKADMDILIHNLEDRNILFHIYFGDPSLSTANPNLLTIDQWCKSFNKPLITDHQELIHQLGLVHYYYPISNMMIEKSIVSMDTFLSELLSRSITAYYIKEHYDEATYKIYMDYQSDQGFYMIEESVEHIIFYTENRQVFKSIEEFIPFYLKELSFEKDEIITEYYTE